MEELAMKSSNEKNSLFSSMLSAGLRRKRVIAIVLVTIFAVMMPGAVTALDDSYEGGYIFLDSNQLSAVKAFLTGSDVGSVASDIPKVNSFDVVPRSYIKQPKGNEQIVWNFLIDQGFSDEQAAGIMGNFQQEHNFRTDGDGLAQWTGNRKKNLRSKSNWTTLEGQLEFLMYELNGSYIYVRNWIYNCTSVDQATLAFMNGYERPGKPAVEKRLYYARVIYNKYHK